MLTKIAVTIPDGLLPVLEDPAVGTLAVRDKRDEGKIDVARLRAWRRQSRKLAIQYVDQIGHLTERTIWPFLVGYVYDAWAVAAWCELRDNFRIFLIDSLLTVEFLEERYPERRAVLRPRWLTMMAEQRQF